MCWNFSFIFFGIGSGTSLGFTDHEGDGFGWDSWLLFPIHPYKCFLMKSVTFSDSVAHSGSESTRLTVRYVLRNCKQPPHTHWDSFLECLPTEEECCLFMFTLAALREGTNALTNETPPQASDHMLSWKAPLQFSSTTVCACLCMCVCLWKISLSTLSNLKFFTLILTFSVEREAFLGAVTGNICESFTILKFVKHVKDLLFHKAPLLDANGFPLLSCSPEWRSSKGSPPAVAVWSHFCSGEGNRWPPSDPPGRRASAERDKLWTACWPLGKISSCAAQARRREPNDGAQMTEAIGLWLADIAAGFCKLSYSWVRVGKGAERLKWEWMYWSRCRYENDTRKLIFAGGGGKHFAGEGTLCVM